MMSIAKRLFPAGGPNRLRAGLACLLSAALLSAAQPAKAADSDAAALIGGIPASAFFPTVDHVGIVVADADGEAEKLRAGFGAQIVNKVTIDFPEAAYKGGTLAYSAYFVFVDLGNVKIEFIQPEADKPSPYLDFLTERGNQAHHLAFLVENAEERLQKLQESNPGIEVVVRAKAGTGDGGRMVYVEGAISGILVELAEPL